MPKYDGLGEGKLPCLCAVSYKPFQAIFRKLENYLAEDFKKVVFICYCL